ncbi:HPF/RaiA family ribosome-associated protein [Nocardia takedensis]|uniref:HPF/RaiA family ribosome-associated protein n=1 Tax=Nocardia takedensis TaxID=259390 RepID=UPI000317C494|nr:HPF/RaiA family ribosome-associated protein [Nocardia takedensis]
MRVQINTDSNIHGGEDLIQRASERVEDVLGRFEPQLTRVDAHLSDQNANKGGPDDKQCVLEARATGQPPLAVTHRADTVEDAYTGAADALAHLLDSRLGRLHHAKGGESIRHLPVE